MAVGGDDLSGRGRVPGSTSSSPVAITATTGFSSVHGGLHSSSPRQGDIAGIDRTPGLSSVSPVLVETAAAHILGSPRGLIDVTEPASAGYFSWITRRIRAARQGAPVKMRTASSGLSAPVYA